MSKQRGGKISEKKRRKHDCPWFPCPHIAPQSFDDTERLTTLLGVIRGNTQRPLAAWDDGSGLTVVAIDSRKKIDTVIRAIRSDRARRKK